jgi:hypothetical protein
MRISTVIASTPGPQSPTFASVKIVLPVPVSLDLHETTHRTGLFRSSSGRQSS